MPTCSSSVARARRSLVRGRHDDASTRRKRDPRHRRRCRSSADARWHHAAGALSRLLARQRAFLRHGPRLLAERRANLKKLRAALLARRVDFEAALDADFGRSRHETGIMEMLVVTWGIDYLHKNLRRFMRPSAGAWRLMRLARAHVEYQPLGVVGIVAPWNYPFLALMPLATALAAGNRAMIKPSELTPATSDSGLVDRRDLLRGRSRRRHRRRLHRRGLRGAAVRSPSSPGAPRSAAR